MCTPGFQCFFFVSTFGPTSDEPKKSCKDDLPCLTTCNALAMGLPLCGMRFLCGPTPPSQCLVHRNEMHYLYLLDGFTWKAVQSGSLAVHSLNLISSFSSQYLLPVVWNCALFTELLLFLRLLFCLSRPDFACYSAGQ